MSKTQTWLLVIALAWVPAAAAVPSAESEHPHDLGMALQAIGDGQQAAEIAAALLELDEEDLAAHQVYQYAWSSRGDGFVLLEQYERWYEAEPGNEFARIALAMMMPMLQNRIEDPWGRMRTLLDPLPESPRARYWALQLYGYGSVMKISDFDEEANWRDQCAAAAASGVPRLERTGTVMRMKHEPVDRQLASDVQEAVRAQPALLGYLAFLFEPDGAKGTHAASLRRFARREAERALSSDDPVLLLTAASFFGAMGDEESEAIADREIEKHYTGAFSWGFGPTRSAIFDAAQRYDPELGLSDLAAIEGDVPPEGPLRSRFESTRGDLLLKLDRDAEAHEAFRVTIHGEAPEMFHVITFAQSAVRTDQDRELALELLETRYQRLISTDYDRDAELGSVGIARWSRYHRRSMAQVLHAQADVLIDLERHDEAVDVLVQACTLGGRTSDHQALARLYESLGRDEAAFEHRLRATAQRLHHYPDAFAEAGPPEALRVAWENGPYWHRDGFEGFLADQAAALKWDDQRRWGCSSASVPTGTYHPLMGQPFPDLAYLDGERERHLSDHEGVLLVQLWNPG